MSYKNLSMTKSVYSMFISHTRAENICECRQYYATNDLLININFMEICSEYIIEIY